MLIGYIATWQIVLDSAGNIASQGNVVPIPATSSSGGTVFQANSNTDPSTQAIVPNAGGDNYVQELANMPLDPDDSRILGKLVEDRLRRLSCDSSTRGWESVALLRDYARIARHANDSTSD